VEDQWRDEGQSRPALHRTAASHESRRQTHQALLLQSWGQSNGAPNLRLQPPAARFPRGDGCPGSLESNGIFKGGSNAND
jgi:hypothetical protein